MVMRAPSLTARFLAVPAACFALAAAAPAPAQTEVSGAVKTVRTGWNADSFAIVLSGRQANPASCPTVDGYLADAAQPGYDTYLDAVLAAYRAGSLVTLAIDNAACAQGRPRLIGVNQIPMPEPERRTVTLRVSRWNENNTVRAFSDVPVIGTFTGRGTDCSRGRGIGPSASPPAGAGAYGDAGWGQVEGSGRPGSNSDSCVSWVRRFAFDFDLGPFTSVPGLKQLERAVLRYDEAETPVAACHALVYTQGGYLFDPLTCWTNGAGNRQDKPQGCLFLRVPSVDWGPLPNDRPKPLLGTTFRKTAPRGGWDVTDLFRARAMPGLTPPPELGGSTSLGWGFALVGSFTDTGQLDAEDNERCTSRATNIGLEVTFVVIPSVSGGDPDIIR